MKKLLQICLIVLIGLPAYTQGVDADSKQLCGLTGKELLEVRRDVKKNILSLKAAGKLRFVESDIAAVQQQRLLEPQAPIGIRFDWPMRPKNAEDYRYYHIGNYTDLDTTGEECIRDYNGGHRTYNGHQGIDIGIGPYQWARQKAGDIYAVAAAPGIIVERHDGEFDRNCDWDNITGSTGRGNHVVILHADDSTVSFYMHLKNGSVTNKQIGDAVVAGEILGSIASSGRSTGPHLHFQVNTSWTHPEDDKGFFVDPFFGQFNWTTTVSLWKSQKEYNEPGIYDMETHLGTTMDSYTSNCDSVVSLSTLRTNFQPNNTIGFRTYLIDWVDGSQVVGGVLDPSGNIYHTWGARTNQCTYWNNWCKYNTRGDICRVYHLNENLTLPANAPAGTYTYWVQYNGIITHHYFSVGCLQTMTFSGTQGGRRGFLVSNTITSTSTIAGISSNRITYKADNYVLLSPGFVATAGCEFSASTEGCTTGK
ncbi:MAG: M23 family metallopeptidase [Chitinophagaceae bacterium]|nr:M23 family metallopeptidase [Chitinophagaceae bacterium]